MGAEGLLTAMAALRARAMPYAGVGRNLAEARMPVYLDTPMGSLAVISCTASFAPASAAAPASALMQGRPGVSPLRHHTILHVTDAPLPGLRDIEGATGLRARRRAREELLGRADKPGEFRFLGASFRRAARPGITTVCDLNDVLDISAWVADARRQADAVLV